MRVPFFQCHQRRVVQVLVRLGRDLPVRPHPHQMAGVTVAVVVLQSLPSPFLQGAVVVNHIGGKLVEHGAPAFNALSSPLFGSQNPADINQGGQGEAGAGNIEGGVVDQRQVQVGRLVFGRDGAGKDILAVFVLFGKKVLIKITHLPQKRIEAVFKEALIAGNLVILPERIQQPGFFAGDILIRIIII